MRLDRRQVPWPDWLQRHAVWIFVAGAYLISWGTAFPIIGPSGIPARAETAASARGLAFIAMALGPPLAALLLTAAFDRLEGINDLVARLTRWRVPALDYVLAVGLVPATAAVVGIAASALAPELTPLLLTTTAPASVLLFAVGAGLVAGWFEEIGWTGFALHRMLPRLGLLRSGVVLGAVHGAWHLLVGYWGEGAAMGALYLPYFLSAWGLGLVALRVLIAWLYRRTRSLLIAQLTHASYTGGLLMLWPSSPSPTQLTVWSMVFAAALCIVVAGICRPGRGHA